MLPYFVLWTKAVIFCRVSNTHHFKWNTVACVVTIFSTTILIIITLIWLILYAFLRTICNWCRCTAILCPFPKHLVLLSTNCDLTVGGTGDIQWTRYVPRVSGDENLLLWPINECIDILKFQRHHRKARGGGGVQENHSLDILLKRAFKRGSCILPAPGKKFSLFFHCITNVIIISIIINIYCVAQKISIPLPWKVFIFEPPKVFSSLASCMYFRPTTLCNFQFSCMLSHFGCRDPPPPRNFQWPFMRWVQIFSGTMHCSHQFPNHANKQFNYIKLNKNCWVLFCFE